MPHSRIWECTSLQRSDGWRHYVGTYDIAFGVHMDFRGVGADFMTAPNQSGCLDLSNNDMFIDILDYEGVIVQCSDYAYSY
jgi:hypothetical protein